MALNFDPSAYERITERKQNAAQQNNQAAAQAVSSIPQAMLAYLQQQKEQEQQGRQNRLSDLNTGIALQNAGADPVAGLAYLSGAAIKTPQQNTGTTEKLQSPQQNPMSQMMQQPGPQAMPAPATGGTPPAPLLSPQSSGRGVLDHWDQTNQDKPHLHTKTTLGDVFKNQQQDYGDVINKMAGGDYSGFQTLTPKQQALLQDDPRYKQMVKPDKQTDNLNYSQAKLIVPTIREKDFNAAYPNGIPREHLSMMSKPTALSTMNTSTYETATPDDQRLARNLVDGKIRPSDIGYRDRGRIVSLASEYADMNGKDFSSYGGDIKAGMSKNLAYGKMGQNVVSFNTALGHIGDAETAFKQVGNTDQRWLNQPLNILKKKGNDPNIIALDLNLHAVAGELATAFKGSGGTDQEIGHFAALLTDDLTPSQAHAALQKAAQLLNSRINAMQNQQTSVMGNNGGTRELLSPHGSDVMNQMKQSSENQPRVQINQKTGQKRISYDGGQTWQIQ